MKILYHCSLADGGLALYSQHHAAAIAAVEGVQVLWHAPETLRPPEQCQRVAPLELPRRKPARGRMRRAIDFYSDTLSPYRELTSLAEALRPDAVILSCWGEYFAPLWAPQLGRLRKGGVKVAAVVHDPVRSFVRGPKWWHDWSLNEACGVLDVALVHDAGIARHFGLYDRSRILELPCGPFPVPVGAVSKEQLRQELSIPLNAMVLLSFGHIRDGKNLDEIIAALPSLPSAHLLVAGREQSAGQKPAAHYQELASRLGVAARCHWHTSYIPNEEVWKYFRASDVLLLTYSPDFRSASGVLNVNAQFGLPVLASAGAGPLLDAVKQYQLGVILLKPDANSIAQATPAVLRIKGEWQKFAEENSWRINAERVVRALSEQADGAKS